MVWYVIVWDEIVGLLAWLFSFQVSSFGVCWLSSLALLFGWVGDVVNCM